MHVSNPYYQQQQQRRSYAEVTRSSQHQATENQINIIRKFLKEFKQIFNQSNKYGKVPDQKNPLSFTKYHIGIPTDF